MDNSDTKWKTGDWCYCEHKLVQIKEMQGTNIVSISDGFSESYSSDWNDSCFPMTMKVKQISDAFENCYMQLNNQLGKLGGNYNFPDFHRYSVSLWRRAITQPDKDWIKIFEKWCDDVIEKAASLKDLKIDGIPLMRQ